jgi:hypothetical protein
MKIRFLPIAEWELDDAFEWYEQQVPGLGYEFLDEMDRTIRRIKIYPKSFAEIKLGIRRALVKRFPFCFIFSVEEEIVVIIAVAHLHREPHYWVDRLN